MSRSFIKKKQGFTLIEFAIVIVMASILASVATPIYFGFTDGAKWTEAKTVVSALKRQVEVYKALKDNDISGLAQGNGTNLSFKTLSLSQADFTSLQYFDPEDFQFVFDNDGTDGLFTIYVNAANSGVGGLSSVGPEAGEGWYKSVDNSWSGELK